MLDNRATSRDRNCAVPINKKPLPANTEAHQQSSPNCLFNPIKNQPETIGKSNFAPS